MRVHSTKPPFALRLDRVFVLVFVLPTTVLGIKKSISMALARVAACDSLRDLFN
jgi:hypothetical protein